MVEDNADIRQYIVDTFSDDFRILQAENGLQGAEMAEEHGPDIIVSDIMMPKMNGIELTRRLKDDIRTCHIPIILLTAKSTDEDKEEGYDSGADSYLTKPFTAKLLASRIRNLLTARRRLTEMIVNGGTATMTPAEEEASAMPKMCRLDREFIERLDSLIEAGEFVKMVENRQGIQISAVEEIAYINGWISKEKLLESAAKYGKSPYGQHLRKVAEGKIRY